MRKTQTLSKVPFLAPEVVTKVIPAPTDGWDAISPLAEMDPKRAPILQNWVPRPGYVELRGGYNQYNNLSAAFQVNGQPFPVSTPVESLMVRRATGGEKLFAAAGGGIFDVSITGTSTLVFLGPFQSNRWQYVNFTPANGTTVIQAVNGLDNLIQYDGTSWTQPSITGFPAGFGSNTITNINSQKRRLWYILKNSTVAAYMPTDAISGAIAGTQDMGALWAKGGILVAMTSWTIDGGAGPQDYAAFISSRGQISIFSGTDPTNANIWALVGTFDGSPPIGNRCVTRVGSDVAIITEAGVIPISQVLPFDPSADRSVAITARIQNAMALASLNFKTNFGWQFISFPAQTLALLNVPITENVSQQQYVMNALTGAWGQFIGWNANCFELFKDNLFFGDNAGGIQQAYVGTTDGFNSIPADMQCAFNWLEDPGKVKRMTMVQPLLNLGGNLTPTLAVDTDFQTSTATAPVGTLQGGSLWDVATWGDIAGIIVASQLVGSISGTVLTVTVYTYPSGGPLSLLGSAITGTGVTVGTTITSFGTASPSNPIGTYNLSQSSTVSSEYMTAFAPASSFAGGSIWSLLSVNFTNWLTVDAIGHALALRMRVNVTAGNLLTLGEFDIGQFDHAVFDGGSVTTLPTLQVNAFNAIAEYGAAI